MDTLVPLQYKASSVLRHPAGTKCLLCRCQPPAPNLLVFKKSIATSCMECQIISATVAKIVNRIATKTATQRRTNQLLRPQHNYSNTETATSSQFSTRLYFGLHNSEVKYEEEEQCNDSWASAVVSVVFVAILRFQRHQH